MREEQKPPSLSFYHPSFILPDVNCLNKKRCVVILSGGLPLSNLSKDDMVICADSGILSLGKGERQPDILIGDMDSLPPELVDTTRKKGVSVEVHPREKDLTDGELAVKRAISLSPDKIDIYGGKCGRADHVLTSFHLLHSIPQEIESTLYLDHDQVILIREGSSFFGSTGKSVVSILPAFKSAMVTLRGLKWELEHQAISTGSTLGIHNESMGKPFEVMAESGDIYLILADEVPPG
jgi:thiamine pyrophosphokinase